MQKHPIMLRLDADDAEALTKWARRQKLPVAAFIREVMHDWLKVNPPWPTDDERGLHDNGAMRLGERLHHMNQALGVRSGRPWVLPLGN